jgi:D-glycero-alpha-D-manno-heptose 1-phosphate guanylyltransferase
MQAIILAGGFGTRLSPVVSDMPKPMAPVAGRPFLCSLFERMAAEGVTEAMLCVHHMHERIRHYFGNRYAGIRLSYAVEETPLGTGGAILQAMRLLAPRHPVFVLNGDSYVSLDYRRMMQAHLAGGRTMTMAAHLVPDCSRYSALTLADNRIVNFDLLGNKAAGLVSVGFYVASPELFDGTVMPQAFSFERDFLAVNVPAIKPAAYAGVDYFIDIGVPEDYARSQAEIPAFAQASVAA